MPTSTLEGDRFVNQVIGKRLMDSNRVCRTKPSGGLHESLGEPPEEQLSLTLASRLTLKLHIIFQTHPLDHVELGFKEINVLFFSVEDLRK